jgi:hypothetical protein
MTGTPWDWDTVPLDVLRKLNADQGRTRMQRTKDIGAPRIISLKTATDTTAGSWNRITDLQRPSVLQLLVNGLPTAHSIYLTSVYPDDNTEPIGAFLSNAGGTAYMLQPGDWWVYIPNLTGDPATFYAVLIDASSELPAQLAALQSVANSGTQIVTTVNRSGFKVDQLNVTTSGTPVNYGTSRTVPNGFGLVVAAKPSNTKNIYLGDTSADALKTGGHAIILSPGTSVKLFITNWNLIWIDSDVNGEGVSLGSEV